MKTLKVKELIEQLSKFDPELPVILDIDGVTDCLCNDVYLFDYMNNEQHFNKFLQICGTWFNNKLDE